MAVSKFRCGEILVDCKMLPLIDLFSPLATSFEAPIVAGETLYPTVEHYVAAQLLRDVQRLEAVSYVPMQISRVQLRHYLQASLINVPEEEIEKWKRNRMFSALKAATELKFTQYPELKALLIQTGDALLIEVAQKDDNNADEDWGIGMKSDSLLQWMRKESISPLALAFFTMHPDCKPGVIGSNMTSRLLMELRQQYLDIKQEMNGDGILQCPLCKKRKPSAVAVSDEIVILAGPTNPLNFDYPSTFVIDGRNYFNVEHFVKYKLLEEFGIGDQVSAGSSDLSQRKLTFFKHMADFVWDRRHPGSSGEATDASNLVFPSISSLHRWSRTRAMEYYEMALMAKFTQNPHLTQALVASGDALLVELRCGKGERARFEMLEYGGFSSKDENWHNVDPAGFVKWMEKFGLNASNVYGLFESMRTDNGGSLVSFLPNLGKNRLGILLMQLRQKFKCSTTTVPISPPVPSLHQFFANFVAQLLDADGAGQSVKARTRLHRVNTFIVKVDDDQRQHGASISADGRCNPLSIFYLAPFTAEGLCFPTLEHYRWWKFFEYQSKFVQCVPGFWDHTDGRQLRAICDQWTKENLRLNAASVLERYRMDVEFDVLRNGALLKHSQNPHLLPLLFDAGSYGPIIAGESEGDATFGVGMQVTKVRRLVERWKITPQCLTLWWTSLKCIKPINMGDNLYGLALMSARDELFAVYCERAVATIPMAPTVQNFNEITSEENFFIQDLEPELIFVFSMDHDTLGLNGPIEIGERQHESVGHFLLRKCLEDISKDAKSITMDSGESQNGILELWSKAKKTADSAGLSATFDEWFDSGAVVDTLRKAARAKVEQDSKFRNDLMGTGKALLVTVTTSGEREERGDNAHSVMRLVTVGLTEDELNDLLRDLRPPSTAVLQFWTRSGAVLRGNLGENLWAACLMAERKAIKADGTNQDSSMETMDQQCFWNLDAIPDKPKHFPKKRPANTEKEGTDPKVESDLTGTADETAGDLQKMDETGQETMLTLPLLPDCTSTGTTVEADLDREADASVQPIAEAMRACGSLYERVVASSKNSEQVKAIGERLAEQVLLMFGECAPDLTTFTEEDMYNLGRIAACQIGRTQ